jgi:hypothetical protein
LNCATRLELFADGKNGQVAEGADFLGHRLSKYRKIAHDRSERIVIFREMNVNFVKAYGSRGAFHGTIDSKDNALRILPANE